MSMAMEELKVTKMVNVSNDTGLLPPGCPVRSMKLTLGTIVSPQKQ